MFSSSANSSLRYKALIGSLVVIFTLLGIVIFNTYRLLHTLQLTIVETSVRQMSETLNLALTPNTTPEGMESLESYFKELITGDGRGIVYLAVLDEQGNILVKSDTLPQPLPQQTQNIEQGLEQGMIHIVQPILLYDNRVGSLHYGLATGIIGKAKREILIDSLTLLTLSTLIVVAIIMYVGMRFNQRISLLMNASSSLAEGHFDTHAPDSGCDELARLAQNFNQMAQAVKARQLALEASEHRMRATLDCTPNVAVQWFDADSRVIMWNPASETLFGVTAVEAIGQPIDNLFTLPADAIPFNRLIQNIIPNERAPQPRDMRIVCRDGKVVDTLSTTFAIAGGEDKPLFASISVDITKQKLIESELELRVESRTQELAGRNHELSQAIEQLKLTQNKLVQSEKLASLGSIVAAVAHELNTPIGNARVVASSLSSRTEEFVKECEQNLRKSDLLDYIDHANQACLLLERSLVRAADLINSFKRVAADQTSSQRRPFDLRETLLEIASTLRPSFKKSGHELILEIPPGIEMESYPGPLGQVIGNLINNALLHAFDDLQNGNMRLSVSREAEQDQVRIVFCDDGAGIPAASLNRIYDPFFTTKLGAGGSGLGLNIVHNIVTGILAGEIEVSSAPGHGTRFQIRLPRVAPCQKASQEMPA